MRTYRCYGTLLLLSGFLILLQLGLFLPRLSPWFASNVSQEAISSVVWIGMLKTVATHLFIWLLGTLLLGRLCELALRQFQIPESEAQTFGIGVWLIAVITLFSANQIYFPRSLFSDFSSTLLNPALAYTFFYSGMLLLGLLMIVALINIKQHLWEWISLSALFALLTITQYLPKSAQTTQPNIIIIGIDSLRTDYLSQTPKIAEFIRHATHFENTITPLGRTFPAWVSILTGLPPKDNGARYDLTPPDQVKRDAAFTHTLQKNGYTTIFATDETRFSNIDASYGFDHVIQPPFGVNDFIFGHYNDFPLSNFISNTRLGYWLFPNNYANRGSFLTYYPESFNQNLRDGLPRAINKPLFLAVHFCLPHWPYFWAATPRNENPSKSLAMLRDLYIKSLQRADQQFEELIEDLKQRHLYENSFIIVLSDHGESLGLPGDRLTEIENFIPKNQYEKSQFAAMVAKERLAQANTSLGHGTDVLSPSQYQVVLALRLPNTTTQIPRWKFPTSLIDIKSTILHFAGLPHEGVSLLPYLKDANYPTPSTRELTTETDLSPTNIINGNPTEQDLIEFGATHYQTNPITGQVTLKPSTMDFINKTKQIATFKQNLIIARYPTTTILYDINTHKWKVIE